MATAKKKAAPKKATAEDTSAKTREKVAAYKKTGQGYVDTYNKYGNRGDLAGQRGPKTGYTIGTDKTGAVYGFPEYGQGRTAKRAVDQANRAYKKKVVKRASAAKVAKGKK
jgi:hypothetical protein